MFICCIMGQVGADDDMCWKTTLGCWKAFQVNFVGLILNVVI